MHFAVRPRSHAARRGAAKCSELCPKFARPIVLSYGPPVVVVLLDLDYHHKSGPTGDYYRWTHLTTILIRKADRGVVR